MGRWSRSHFHDSFTLSAGAYGSCNTTANVTQKREIPYSEEKCAAFWTWIYTESSESVHDGDPKKLAHH
jgi:hypothetical protein